MHKKTILSKAGRILRSVAFVTLTTFTTTLFTPSSFSFAQNPYSKSPGGDPVSASVRQTPDGRFVIPPELGLIEESFHGISGKTILFIQDAHDSLEAQEHIAKIINLLVSDYGIKTVFEEGYKGPVPTDKYFGFLKDPELKRKVSYFFLDHLRIGGAEYAHINRTRDFQLIGADSILLHQENIHQYRLSAEKKEAISQDLKVLAHEVQSLAAKRFPKELLEWLKLKDRFDHKEIDLLAYLGRTLSLLEKGERHLFDENKNGSFPLLKFILEAMRSNDPAVMEKVKHIDAREVYAALSKLEGVIGKVYLKDPIDKELFGYFKILGLLERLNALQVTQEEYEAVKADLKTFGTESLGGFIHEHARKPLVLSKQWERNVQEAINFYEIASARDRALGTVLDEHFFGEAPVQTRAILVFGGFHKENIKRTLEAKNISYLVVSPRITQPSLRHEKFYKRLMTEGRLSYELPANVPMATRAESSIEVWDGNPALARWELGVLAAVARDMPRADNASLLFAMERTLQNFSDRIPARSETRNAEAIFMRAGNWLKKNISVAQMTDALGVDEKDRVLLVGVGTTYAVPVAFALHKAKVFVSQPEDDGTSRVPGPLKGYLEDTRANLKHALGEDPLSDLIDTETYRGLIEGQHLPEHYFSHVFFPNVLETMHEDNRKAALENVLKACRDQVTLLYSVFQITDSKALKIREQIETLARAQGYQVTEGRSFQVKMTSMDYYEDTVRELILRRKDPSSRSGGPEAPAVARPAGSFAEGKTEESVGDASVPKALSVLDLSTNKMTGVGYRRGDELSGDEREHALNSLRKWERGKLVYDWMYTRICGWLSENSLHLKEVRFAVSDEGNVEGYVHAPIIWRTEPHFLSEPQSPKPSTIHVHIVETRPGTYYQGIGEGLFITALGEYPRGVEGRVAETKVQSERFKGLLSAALGWDIHKLRENPEVMLTRAEIQRLQGYQAGRIRQWQATAAASTSRSENREERLSNRRKFLRMASGSLGLGFLIQEEIGRAQQVPRAMEGSGIRSTADLRLALAIKVMQRGRYAASLEPLQFTLWKSTNFNRVSPVLEKLRSFDTEWDRLPKQGVPSETLGTVHRAFLQDLIKAINSGTNLPEGYGLDYVNAVARVFYKDLPQFLAGQGFVLSIKAIKMSGQGANSRDFFYPRIAMPDRYYIVLKNNVRRDFKLSSRVLEDEKTPLILVQPARLNMAGGKLQLVPYIEPWKDAQSNELAFSDGATTYLRADLLEQSLVNEKTLFGQVPGEFIGADIPLKDVVEGVRANVLVGPAGRTMARLIAYPVTDAKAAAGYAILKLMAMTMRTTVGGRTTFDVEPWERARIYDNAVHEMTHIKNAHETLWRIVWQLGQSAGSKDVDAGDVNKADVLIEENARLEVLRKVAPVSLKSLLSTAQQQAGGGKPVSNGDTAQAGVLDAVLQEVSRFPVRYGVEVVKGGLKVLRPKLGERGVERVPVTLDENTQVIAQLYRVAEKPDRVEALYSAARTTLNIDARAKALADKYVSLDPASASPARSEMRLVADVSGRGERDTPQPLHARAGQDLFKRKYYGLFRMAGLFVGGLILMNMAGVKLVARGNGPMPGERENNDPYQMSQSAEGGTEPFAGTVDRATRARLITKFRLKEWKSFVDKPSLATARSFRKRAEQLECQGGEPCAEIFSTVEKAGASADQGFTIVASQSIEELFSSRLLKYGIVGRTSFTQNVNGISVWLFSFGDHDLFYLRSNSGRITQVIRGDRFFESGSYLEEAMAFCDLLSKRIIINSREMDAAFRSKHLGSIAQSIFTRTFLRHELSHDVIPQDLSLAFLEKDIKKTMGEKDPRLVFSAAREAAAFLLQLSALADPANEAFAPEEAKVLFDHLLNYAKKDSPQRGSYSGVAARYTLVSTMNPGLLRNLIVGGKLSSFDIELYSGSMNKLWKAVSQKSKNIVENFFPAFNLTELMISEPTFSVVGDEESNRSEIRTPTSGVDGEHPWAESSIILKGISFEEKRRTAREIWGERVDPVWGVNTDITVMIEIIKASRGTAQSKASGDTQLVEIFEKYMDIFMRAFFNPDRRKDYPLLDWERLRKFGEPLASIQDKNALLLRLNALRDDFSQYLHFLEGADDPMAQERMGQALSLLREIQEVGATLCLFTVRSWARNDPLTFDIAYLLSRPWKILFGTRQYFSPTSRGDSVREVLNDSTQAGFMVPWVSGIYGAMDEGRLSIAAGGVRVLNYYYPYYAGVVRQEIDRLAKEGNVQALKLTQEDLTGTEMLERGSQIASRTHGSMKGIPDRLMKYDVREATGYEGLALSGADAAASGGEKVSARAAETSGKRRGSSVTRAEGRAPQPDSTVAGEAPPLAVFSDLHIPSYEPDQYDFVLTGTLEGKHYFIKILNCRINEMNEREMAITREIYEDQTFQGDLAPGFRTGALGEGDIRRLESLLLENHIILRPEGWAHKGQPYFVTGEMPGMGMYQHMVRIKMGAKNTPGLRKDYDRQIVTALVAVLKTLSAFHRKGVVHRDLGPGEIFLEWKDSYQAAHARILDFGLSATPSHSLPSDAGPVSAYLKSHAKMELVNTRYEGPERDVISLLVMARWYAEGLRGYAGDAPQDAFFEALSSMTAMVPPPSYRSKFEWQEFVRSHPALPTDDELIAYLGDIERFAGENNLPDDFLFENWLKQHRHRNAERAGTSAQGAEGPGENRRSELREEVENTHQAVPLRKGSAQTISDFERKILPYFEGVPYRVRQLTRMAFSEYGPSFRDRGDLARMDWERPNRNSLERNRKAASAALSKLVQSGWERGAAEALLIRFARTAGSVSEDTFKAAGDFVGSSMAAGLPLEQTKDLLQQYSVMMNNFPAELLKYSKDLVDELKTRGATAEQINQFFVLVLNTAANGSIAKNLNELVHLMKRYPEESTEILFAAVEPLFQKWKWYTFSILYRPGSNSGEARKDLAGALHDAEAEMVAQGYAKPEGIKPVDTSIDARLDDLFRFFAEHGFQRPVYAVAAIVGSVMAAGEKRNEKPTWKTLERTLSFAEDIMRLYSGEIRLEDFTSTAVEEDYGVSVSRELRSLLEQERRYKNDPLFYGSAGLRLFPQGYLELVEKIREEPARFSQWLSHHVPNKARHSKVDVKTYKEMSSAEQRLVEVLQDPASLRLFLKAVTLLRMVFPYDSDFGNDKTPLEFAKEKGLIFPFMEGIRISPATQSFRRHLVGVTGRDGKETWFEIKIPGRDEGRDQIFENTMDVATAYRNAYPEHKEDIVEPLALLTTRGVVDGFYGYPAKFTSKEPLRLALFGYEDGNRLVHLETIVNPEGVFSTHKTIIDQAFHSRFIIGDLARSSTLESLEARLKLSKGEEALHLTIERMRLMMSGLPDVSVTPEYKAFLQDKSLQAMRIGLRFLELGYRGYNEHATDWHLENFRLLLSGKVQAVADFNVFEKGPVPRTEWKAEIQKLLGFGEEYLQGEFDRLYEQALAAHDREIGTARSEIRKDDSRSDRAGKGGIPEEVFGIVQQLQSAEQISTLFQEIKGLKAWGAKLSPKLLSLLETMSLLFGYESGPGLTLINSDGSIFKNWQVPPEGQEAIWEQMYNPENYATGFEDIADVELEVYKALSDLPQGNARIYSRIKQYKSLLEKLRIAISKISGTPIAAVPEDTQGVFHRIIAFKDKFRENPTEYFDDLVGFDIVIDDAGMAEEQRTAAMSKMLVDLKRLLERQEGWRVETVRKEGRAKGYESGNVFVFGLLRHKTFGELPVKIQVRFFNALKHETAMRYVFKTTGKWEYPVWLTEADVDRCTTLQALRETFFKKFKEFASHQPAAKTLNILEHIRWPSRMSDIDASRMPYVVAHSWTHMAAGGAIDKVTKDAAGNSRSEARSSSAPDEAVPQAPSKILKENRRVEEGLKLKEPAVIVIEKKRLDALSRTAMRQLMAFAAINKEELHLVVPDLHDDQESPYLADLKALGVRITLDLPAIAKSPKTAVIGLSDRNLDTVATFQARLSPLLAGGVKEYFALEGGEGIVLALLVARPEDLPLMNGFRYDKAGRYQAELRALFENLMANYVVIASAA